MIAYKFVNHDVLPLEKFEGSGTKVYDIKVKCIKGEKLTREEKDWVAEKLAFSIYGKTSIPCMGWMFSFREYLTRYLVKQYGEWREFWAFDKTSIRHALYGRIDEIIAA